ncbi:protein FAM124A isoform X4 [Oryctolagus cuniculus]|uniref:protein FAM124A isoform X4 n=1 Tax=Oryctolagus cuniculus TaxID=9986 RepID=UPI00387907EC
MGSGVAGILNQRPHGTPALQVVAPPSMPQPWLRSDAFKCHMFIWSILPTVGHASVLSDYSHLSSTSSELSVEEAQDPFLVSIHIIADPGESRPLQEAIDKVLAWIHPDLPLFRVSERRSSGRRRKSPRGTQPALAVVLFLQEEYGEEQILQLHRTLRRPPWRHHHTERVHGRFLPYLPCSQDFFTLAPGTPLWAIRPVHYGKEIVRFTIYCRHDSYADSLRFYELILRRSPSQRKTDFCIFPIFSNLDLDIQFSLKRLPCDQNPVPTDSSVLEFRVKDMGELVPLLPNPCSPISEGRWQTEDHDGNKILLQVSLGKATPSSLLSPLDGAAQTPGLLEIECQGYTGSFPKPAERTTPPTRSLVPVLLQASLPRAVAAARSPRSTAHSQDPAGRTCLPCTSRNLPAAPRALPGVSSEASPCSVCPREDPRQPPPPNHSGFPAQVPQGPGRPSGGTASPSLWMT